MVKNLINAGFNVTVYNRNAEKSEALSKIAKVAIAAHPADLVEKSDFIISMISDDAAVKDVYEGPNGILSVAGRKSDLDRYEYGFA